MVSDAKKMVTENKDNVTKSLTELGEKLTENAGKNDEFMSNLEAKQMELRSTINEQAARISRLQRELDAGSEQHRQREQRFEEGLRRAFEQSQRAFADWAAQQ